MMICYGFLSLNHREVCLGLTVSISPVGSDSDGSSSDSDSDGDGQS